MEGARGFPRTGESGEEQNKKGGGFSGVGVTHVGLLAFCFIIYYLSTDLRKLQTRKRYKV